MKRCNMLLAALAVIAGSAFEVHSAGLQDIDTIVVLYAENRSFDNLYGSFPGANGLSQVTPAEYMQRDRDGSVLKELPPVWDGVTAKGVVPAVTQAQTEHLPNAPFAIDDCAPTYPQADQSPAKGLISAVEADGVTLKAAADSPKSALEGIPKFVNDGNLSPDFYAVNTMQPAYQPSANKPALEGDPAYANAAAPTTLPPQTEQTIGDLLTGKGVTWAWYAGAWQATLDGKNAAPVPNFQYHHQPFNYFAAMAPGTAARAEHLKDGGLGGSEFLKAIDNGALPQVAFYKPQGNLNEHPGYTDVLGGDQHIADVIAHLQKSPQWARMAVIVTYDENGGFWDHVAPPKGDRWGPGSRVPALIVSPLAKKGFVDHTLYDTTSILRLITGRFNLPPLPGLAIRDTALAANGSQPLGDLTNALDFSPR